MYMYTWTVFFLFNDPHVTDHEQAPVSRAMAASPARELVSTLTISSCSPHRSRTEPGSLVLSADYTMSPESSLHGICRRQAQLRHMAFTLLVPVSSLLWPSICCFWFAQARISINSHLYFMGVHHKRLNATSPISSPTSQPFFFHLSSDQLSFLISLVLRGGVYCFRHCDTLARAVVALPSISTSYSTFPHIEGLSYYRIGWGENSV
ncbi:hypothetical protein QBC38DRAFT_95810 [Podospora fimiseda]|uniref:Uncharacterized protein n=1 Tax=Podospora fimiseda TaxID=252190 RepID=A0AAN7BZB4_9PEZI|nr:hypothetical protein QBC38DRAFT_95810 [Podospora fimiseda]